MAAVLLLLRGLAIYVSVTAGAVTYLAAIYLLRAIDPEEWRLGRAGLSRLAALRSR